jgi:hypothetical protein
MTILSNGGGQDTTYLIWRFAIDPDFRKRHVVEPLLIIGADTGAEHPHTYANVKAMEAFCKDHGMYYVWVTPDLGFHPRSWQSLTGQYKRNNSIGSAAFRQTCTDNLKVKVVDNYVESYLKLILFDENPPPRKKAYYEYTRRYGQKIRLILGFAAKEESRTRQGNKHDAKWKKDNVERHYPLIIEGIDRQAAIDFNEQHIPWKVWPSNCMICFYSSDQEILWLYRFYPEVFADWVAMEQAKINKYAGKEKNFGVYGKITLQQKLEKAQKLYGHMTDEELNEYKFSHGHCIKSSY